MFETYTDVEFLKLFFLIAGERKDLRGLLLEAFQFVDLVMFLALSSFPFAG